MYYVDVTVEDLKTLQGALKVLEPLGEPIELYLYALTQDPGIVDAAKEAIAAYSDEEGLSEEDIQLTEVAIEVQLSPDKLYYLVGSGLRLQKGDEFSYMGGQGEGVREIGWNWTRRGPTATVGSFSKMALGRDSGWGDKFLMQYGSKQPMKVEVKRNAPATGVNPMPKQTSLDIDKTAAAFRQVLENFLGD